MGLKIRHRKYIEKDYFKFQMFPPSAPPLPPEKGCLNPKQKQLPHPPPGPPTPPRLIFLTPLNAQFPPKKRGVIDFITTSAPWTRVDLA